MPGVGGLPQDAKMHRKGIINPADSLCCGGASVKNRLGTADPSLWYAAPWRVGYWVGAAYGSPFGL